MVIEKTAVTWEEIQQNIERLHETTSNHDKNEVAIIGISRGGLIPAVLLSQYKTNCTVFTVGVRSYSGHNRQNEKVYQIPDNNELKKYETLYLIDDICDTGLTFKHLLEKQFDNLNIKTISLFYRANSLYCPDYYGVRLVDQTWVVFPWEKE